ncbi:hypothetical protein BGZ76_008260, partial [Entomortierella beljakovae]
LRRQNDKVLLPNKTDISINKDVSAIENFIRLNKLSENNRKFMSLTPVQQPFISFSEGELLDILWKSDALRNEIRSWNLESKVAGKEYTPSNRDMQNWIMDRAPGNFLTRLISPVGKPIGKREGRRNFKEKTVLMSLQQMRKHIK